MITPERKLWRKEKVCCQRDVTAYRYRELRLRCVEGRQRGKWLLLRDAMERHKPSCIGLTRS